MSTRTPILTALTESWSVSSRPSPDRPSRSAAAQASKAAQDARIDEYVARLVATAPPLTAHEWREIALLLREVPGGQ